MKPTFVDSRTRSASGNRYTAQNNNRYQRSSSTVRSSDKCFGCDKTRHWRLRFQKSYNDTEIGIKDIISKQIKKRFQQANKNLSQNF